jgi:hypothetical protein
MTELMQTTAVGQVVSLREAKTHGKDGTDTKEYQRLQ